MFGKNGFDVTICHVKIFLNVFAFLYVKVDSKEICEEIFCFPSFFRKMSMSAFLFRFKANYLEKMIGYPNCSLWIPLALAKIYMYFFHVVLTWRTEAFVLSKHLA